jgi:hypothetical protein
MERNPYDEFRPNEEIYFDTSERILALSDRLAEEIILESIEEQLTTELDALNSKINYVSLFREKYAEITPEDAEYDDEYMKQSLANIATCIGENIKQRYGVEIGTDLDYATPAQYLEDMETLYEFLFIRHYENLVDYFKHKLYSNRQQYINMYSSLMEDEKHSKDLFVIQSKKKFKSKEDVLIMHFMNEIIRDIKDSTTSAYDLFSEICKLDIFEEFNQRMSQLIFNYGNKLVLNNDSESARLYMKPLENPSVFSELRNTILMDYLENCLLDD